MGQAHCGAMEFCPRLGQEIGRGGCQDSRMSVLGVAPGVHRDAAQHDDWQRSQMECLCVVVILENVYGLAGRPRCDEEHTAPSINSLRNLHPPSHPGRHSGPELSVHIVYPIVQRP